MAILQARSLAQSSLVPGLFQVWSLGDCVRSEVWTKITILRLGNPGAGTD